MGWNAFSVFEERCGIEDRGPGGRQRSKKRVEQLYEALSLEEKTALKTQASLREGPSVVSKNKARKAYDARIKFIEGELEALSHLNNSSYLLVKKTHSNATIDSKPSVLTSCKSYIFILTKDATGVFECFNRDLLTQKGINVFNLLYNYCPSNQTLATRERIIEQRVYQSGVTYFNASTVREMKKYIAIHFSQLFRTLRIL